jgi:hypothetical protein
VDDRLWWLSVRNPINNKVTPSRLECRDARIAYKFASLLESLVVKFSVGLSEYSFHAHKLDSTEKFVPIPLLNGEKARCACGVRTACPDAKNITPVEPPVVKFSMALPEHSFHANEKSVPISTFERGKSKMGLWSQNCMSKYRKYYTI